MIARGFDGRSRAAVAATAIVLGIGLVVAIRWHAFRTGALDGVTEGLVFGIGLLTVALLGGSGAAIPSGKAIAAGIAVGGLLVAIAVAARWPLPPLALGHAAPLGPWLAVTTLVATGEELVLRGALWHRLAFLGGDAVALLATSAIFALIHVPVYGWHVVPLDLGVGLCFGGLRLWFGGPAAPATAHVLADVAAWWL
jgi:membrane protease YdiL (CAAX protease family)